MWRSGRVTALVMFTVLAAPPAEAGDGPPLPLRGPLPLQATPPLLGTEISSALDSFGREAASLQRAASELLGHYQRFIFAVERSHSLGVGAPPEACAALPAWGPWVGARQTWGLYDAQARTTRDAARPLEAYTAASYLQGLTPDLRGRLDQSLAAWSVLRQQHSQLANVMLPQMEAEVRRLGCDPDAPDVPPAETSAGATPWTPPMRLPAAVQTTHSAPTPPAPATPAPQAGWGIALAAPAKEGAPAPTPRADLAQITPTEAEAALLASPFVVSFSIDNSRCGRNVVVFVDGERIGRVAAWARGGFATLEGGHAVCISEEGQEGVCIEGLEDREVSIYDGWTVRPGC